MSVSNWLSNVKQRLSCSLGSAVRDAGGASCSSCVMLELLMMLCSSRAASSARLRCSWLKFIVLLLLLLPAGGGSVLLLATVQAAAAAGGIPLEVLLGCISADQRWLRLETATARSRGRMVIYHAVQRMVKGFLGSP
jgi:hypothetical protein